MLNMYEMVDEYFQLKCGQTLENETIASKFVLSDWSERKMFAN